MLWVGTYQRRGGRGLHPLTCVGDTLSLGTPETRIANASFGAWSRRRRIAYFVDEQDAGRVTAWRRDSGEWQESGEHGTGGALPCYLDLHAKLGLLTVANYADGALALLQLDPATGQIESLADLKRPNGRGTDPERQRGPHAHCAVFDPNGQSLFHVDLGLDCIFRYPLDHGRLGEAEVAFAAPAGSGPRHLLLLDGGRQALLLCELSAELVLLDRRANGFVHRQTIGTAPEPATDNLGGHLALRPDGLVLVSNRGHDSLAAFRLEGDGLVPAGWVRTGGTSPRHFHPGQSAVIVALEESDSLSLVPMPQPGWKGRGPIQETALPGAAFIFETSE